MKLKCLKFTVLLFALSFAFGLFAVQKSTAFANSETSTNTQSFVPSSPIEFLDLNSPIAISYNDGYYVISEFSQNPDTLESFNRVSVFNPTTGSYTRLPSHDSLHSISQIKKHGEFIYYVSQSKIYYLPISDLTSEPKIVKDEDGNTVICANFISFNEQNVVANTNNTANIYQIVITDNVPTFKNLYQIKTFAKEGFLSNDGNVYLLENSTLKYFRSVDKTIINLTTISTDVYDIEEVQSFIYFTTVDGLYKVKKQQNSTPTKVLSVDDNAMELGSIKSPKGICSNGDKLLIADNMLNCIQEIDTLTDKFTTFAITTESTADYRLTKNASNIVISENYLYALDDATLNSSDTNVKKRIVKISLDSTDKHYHKIDLSSLYENNLDLNIKLFTASDTHVLIYDGDYIKIYKQKGSSPITLTEIYSYQTSSVTAVNYLDGVFYYSDTSRTDFSYDTLNIHKLTLPTQDNELSEITNTTITSKDVEIKGICTNFTVDIFGNFLILYKENETDTKNKLIRLYNNYLSTTISVEYNPLSIQVDFAGNVYVLSENNLLYKYLPSDDTYTTKTFKVNTLNGDNIKSISLNYKYNEVYYLSNACIYVNSDDNLEVKNLTGISADNVNEKEILNNVTFVTLKETSKLFKVSLNDYSTIENKKYFNKLTPISNPTTTKVYTVIADIDDTYYLVSYSSKLVALVRKTSVNETTNIISDATIISKDKYSEYNITDNDLNYKEYYITNDVYSYAKPIIDDNYKLDLISKNTKVYAVKEIVFNNKTMTLIASENGGEVIGYVVSGYLTTTIVNDNNEYTNTTFTIGNNADKKLKTILMLLIIAFTVTTSFILIERKLLFKEKK